MFRVNNNEVIGNHDSLGTEEEMNSDAYYTSFNQFLYNAPFLPPFFLQNPSDFGNFRRQIIDPTSIYLLKSTNGNTRIKHQNDVMDVSLVSLLLNLNTFHTFWCFHW